MTNPTIYSGSERILRAGVFCTLLDLTLTKKGVFQAEKCENGTSVYPIFQMGDYYKVREYIY